jgi:hypothetical protein
MNTTAFYIQAARLNCVKLTIILCEGFPAKIAWLSFLESWEVARTTCPTFLVLLRLQTLAVLGALQLLLEVTIMVSSPSLDFFSPPQFIYKRESHKNSLETESALLAIYHYSLLYPL